MPRRDDLHKILLIGSGPIVIGQACEFDYSGTQACKALREESYEVVLVNSNPATIMTDPNTADRTYIEPLTWEIVAKVIERERPDALLPTLGGQTGLNLAMDLVATWRAGEVRRRDDRRQCRGDRQGRGARAVQGGDGADRAGGLPRARRCTTSTRRVRCSKTIGLPCVVRPSFTLGGSGSAVAYNRDEFDTLVRRGLDQSPITEVLLEESMLGWKEYEMEVMRDLDDNVVIICSIENFDPMGVHTGDSITVAPAQTLTDKEYQRMRDASLAVIREIGVETGGSNIQFAIRSADGSDGRHRDEPARQPFQRAGLEGDRISDRQDRRQAGGRLSAARIAQRHHARDEGLFRADDRLRGHEDSAFCLREISGSRCHA